MQEKGVFPDRMAWMVGECGNYSRERGSEEGGVRSEEY